MHCYERASIFILGETMTDYDTFPPEEAPTQPDGHPTIPSPSGPPPSSEFATAPVVPAPLAAPDDAPKRPRNDSRGWHDWSVDGPSSLGRPKLRVKGLVEPASPKDLPPMPDHDGWRERNRKLRRAMAEDDNATISKLMEPTLDALHTKDPPKPPVPPIDWDELTPALYAELREWGKSHRVPSGSIALLPLIDGSIAIRLVTAEDPFEIRFDAPAVRSAWRESEGLPRRAAAALVQRGTEELAAAKAREVICVPDFTPPIG